MVEKGALQRVLRYGPDTLRRLEGLENGFLSPTTNIEGFNETWRLYYSKNNLVTVLTNVIRDLENLAKETKGIREFAKIKFTESINVLKAILELLRNFQSDVVNKHLVGTLPSGGPTKYKNISELNVLITNINKELKPLVPRVKRQLSSLIEQIQQLS